MAAASAVAPSQAIWLIFSLVGCRAKGIQSALCLAWGGRCVFNLLDEILRLKVPKCGPKDRPALPAQPHKSKIFLTLEKASPGVFCSCEALGDKMGSRKLVTTKRWEEWRVRERRTLHVPWDRHSELGG